MGVIADGLDEQPAGFRLVHIDLSEDRRQVSFQGPTIMDAVLEYLSEMEAPAVSRSVATSAGIHQDRLDSSNEQPK